MLKLTEYFPGDVIIGFSRWHLARVLDFPAHGVAHPRARAVNEHVVVEDVHPTDCFTWIQKLPQRLL